MYIVDLINPDSEESLKYKYSKFPDGQQDIVLEEMGRESGDTYLIKARLNNFMDLEKITCAVAAIRNTAFKPFIHLVVPYFLGARSDRQFIQGGTWYLKDVITPFINSLNLDEVIIVDPHSDVLPNLIKNVTIVKNWNFVFDCLEKSGHVCDQENPNFVLLSPDAGALKKIFDVAKDLCYKGEIITAVKLRDVRTGKIIKTEVPCSDFQGKDIFIIDDICDGGRTFIELAKIIKDLNPGKINLVVTHGIFSNAEQLNEMHYTFPSGKVDGYFDTIYTTNSYQDFDASTMSANNIKVYDIYNEILK